MKHVLYLLCFLFFSSTATALPLPNGSTAPNFTLTDENGVTHTLYDYLDQGKTVFVEFFATWCGICWNYKQANHLKNLYEQYGPNGTDQVRVLLIEGDNTTPQAALYGGSGSVGNWVAGTPYPVIHAPSNAVPSAYIVNSFPTVYAICPDRKVYNIGTAPLATLTNWIGSCNLNATAQVTNASCAGQTNGSIDLTVTGGTGTISYAWNSGQNTQDVNNLGTGSYSCTLTDSQGRSVAKGPWTITAPQAITAFGLATQPSCHGNDGALAVSAAGGTPPYTYDAGSGPGPNPIITGLAAGNYNVTVTDAGGCEKVVQVTVPQETPPVADAGPDQVITCDVTSVTLNGSGSSTGPNIQFAWSTTNGVIVNPGLLNPTAAAPGLYVLTIIDTETGCVSTDEVIVAADDDVPQITLSNPGAITCETAEIPVSALDLGICFDYEWTTTNGNITVIDGNEIVIDAAGDYLLTVVNTCTGCLASASFVVADATDLEGSFATVQAALCAGENSGAAEAAVTGGTPPYTYLWSDGQIEALVEGLAAGIYTVTISDAGGCEAVLGVEITEPEPLMIAWLGSQPASGPNVPDGVIDYEITGGTPPFTESWYLDGELLTAFDPQAALSGEYQLEVEDSNRCVVLSEIFTLPFNSSVREKAGLQGMQIAPNPAVDFVSLKWDQPLSGAGSFILYNAIGQPVLRQVAEQGAVNAVMLLPSLLPDGPYFLYHESEGVQVVLERFFIHHP